MSFGWEKGDFYVNSAAHLGRDELEDKGWPLDMRGNVDAATLRRFLGVNSGTNVVVGRYGIREYVQQAYQPRGKPLSKSAANQFIADQIVPLCKTTGGVPWIEEERLRETLNSRPKQISALRSDAAECRTRK